MDVLLKIFLISCVALHVHAASIKFCDDNIRCRSGEFCYLKTNTCTPCVDCSIWQRQPSGTCAKEPAQCGDCLAGFESEIFTDGHVRELCLPVASNVSVSPTMDPQPHTIHESNMSRVIVFSVCVLSTTVMILVLLVKLWSKTAMKLKMQTRFVPCNDSPSNLSSALFPPSAPPPSHTGFSECNREDDETEIVHGWIHAKNEEKCQMAGVFCNPVWVKSPPSNNNVYNNEPVDNPEDVVDGPPADEDNQPYLLDENTIPSTWSPGPDYENAQPAGPSPTEPLITSFTGILQLNANAMTATAAAAGAQGPTNHTATENEPGAPHGQQRNFSVTNNITLINNVASPTGVFNISQF